MKYLTVPLESRHDRENFSCGKDLLDQYFSRQAGQDVKRNLAACFVWPGESSGSVKGYYTLSGTSVRGLAIPVDYRKKLPKSYSMIPAILLGRLAVDMEYQGQGLGRLMLVDALRRCVETSGSIGAYALVVDPLDDQARQFYAKYGFIALPDSGKMFLPMKTIRALF